MTKHLHNLHVSYILGFKKLFFYTNTNSSLYKRVADTFLVVFLLFKDYLGSNKKE